MHCTNNKELGDEEHKELTEANKAWLITICLQEYNQQHTISCSAAVKKVRRAPGLDLISNAAIKRMQRNTMVKLPNILNSYL